MVISAFLPNLEFAIFNEITHCQCLRWWWESLSAHVARLWSISSAVVAAISLALTAVGVLTLAEEEIQQTDLMEQQIGE